MKTFCSLGSFFTLILFVTSSDIWNLKEVQQCPTNKTEWESRNRDLNCSSKELSYFCVPYFNLTALYEFCATKTPVEKGICFILNEQKTHIDSYGCDRFRKGCHKEKLLFSSSLYKYPACTNINPVKKCFLAEVTCPGNESLQSTTQTPIHEMENITMDYLSTNAASSKPSTTEVIAKDNLSDVFSRHQLLLASVCTAAGVLISIFSFICVSCFCKRKDKNIRNRHEDSDIEMRLLCNGTQHVIQKDPDNIEERQHCDGIDQQNQNSYMQNGKLRWNRGIRQEALQNQLIAKLMKELKEEDLLIMKRVAKAWLEDADLEPFDTVEKFLEFLNKELCIFSRNLYLLQYFVSETSAADKLVKKCVEFAKDLIEKNDVVSFFEIKPTASDCKIVELHLNQDVLTVQEEQDIKTLVTDLVAKPNGFEINFITIGIQRTGSIMITYLMKSDNADRFLTMKVKELAGLCFYGIDYLIVDGRKLLLLPEDQTIPLNDPDQEKETEGQTNLVTPLLSNDQNTSLNVTNGQENEIVQLLSSNTPQTEDYNDTATELNQSGVRSYSICFSSSASRKNQRQEEGSNKQTSNISETTITKDNHAQISPSVTSNSDIDGSNVMGNQNYKTKEKYCSTEIEENESNSEETPKIFPSTYLQSFYKKVQVPEVSHDFPAVSAYFPDSELTNTVTETQSTDKYLEDPKEKQNINRRKIWHMMPRKSKETDDLKEYVSFKENRMDALENQVEGIYQAKLLGEWKRQDVYFFKTKACQEAEEKLKSSNTLTITGNSGSGKTAIAQHIALLYQKEGYQIIAADSFENIKSKMNPKEKQMFVLNDPVGKERLDEMLEKNIRKHDDTCRMLLKNSNIKLVFTCRKVVINDSKLQCKLLTLCTVEIDGEKLHLSVDEKKGILEKHIDLSNIDKSELSDILKTDHYFPLLSYLYGNNEKYREKGLGFFKGFREIIKKELQHFKNSDKGKFCALILLSACKKGLEEELLTDVGKKCPKVVQEVYEICGFKRNKSRSFLLEQLSSLTGSYVKKVGTLYTFLHDYMMEATTFKLGETHPKYMIQHCSGSFLRNCLAFKTTHLKYTLKSNMESKTEDFTVVLDEKHASVLVERFVSEIKKGNCIDPFLSPCFSHKNVITGFLSKLDDIIRKELLTLRKYDKESLNMEKITGSFTKLDFFLFRTQASPLHLLVIYNFDSIVRAICDKTDMSELREYELFPASCASGNTDLTEYITDKLGLNSHEKWDGKLGPLDIAAIFNYDNIIKFLLQRNICNVNCINYRSTPLMFASLYQFDSNEHEQDSAVKTLINYNADISLCNSDGYSPLYCAAGKGHDSVVKILLNNKADSKMCDKDGNSSLYVAARNGHYSVVKTLLDNKADINMCNNNSVSTLYIAAGKGHDSVVKILLDNKADVNMCDNNGVRPLFIAAHNGHDSVVKILLNYKADVNMRNYDGLSPLYIAAHKGHDSVVKILLNYKADVNMCNYDRLSPLYIAAHKGHDSVVKILLNYKADVNMRDNNGVSPLFIAALNGHDSVVKILLDNKADVNMCNNNGVSPLNIAAYIGHDSVVKILLDNKADVNMCDNNGVRPLYIAAHKEHDSVVKILLDNKADVNMCNYDGLSPLYIAAHKGHDSVVKILLNYKADNKADVNMCNYDRLSPLYIAAHKGHDSVVKILLNYKADVNMCNNNGLSPLYIAAQNGHDSVVKILLDNKADVNMCNYDGLSPLYIAAHKGHDSVVKILLNYKADNKADVNMCNYDGLSPLYIAAHKGHDSVVKILLNYKADVNMCNNNGLSPLYIAAQNGHDSVVKILLDNKADVNMCNYDGVSPLNISDP